MLHPTEQNPTENELAILNEFAMRSDILLCGPTLEQLGRKMGVDSLTAAKMLNALEIKGMIKDIGYTVRNDEQRPKLTPRGRGFATEPQFIRGFSI